MKATFVRIMPRGLLILIISLALLGQSCTDCDDCGPLESNPFVSVVFRQLEDASRIAVTIDELNGQNAREIEAVADTSIDNYRLPIDLNRDTAMFTFRYFSSLDTFKVDPILDTLTVSYRRQTERTELRFLVLRIDSIEVVQSGTTFDSTSISCFTPQCFQSETNISLYF